MTSLTSNDTKKKINTFIISGGTATGKTTILNSLIDKLNNANDKILIVLHQHAKSFGLETTNIINTNKIVSIEQVFDFGSGCICCSPDGDLTRLLSNISATNNADNITHLFIETTGVADVRSFARLFAVEETISVSFQLQSIITVINNNTIKTILEAKDDIKKRQECRELDQFQQANLLIENNFYENAYKQDNNNSNNIISTAISINNNTTIISHDIMHELKRMNKFASIITKGKLNDVNMKWDDINTLIELEHTNANRVKISKEDDCNACTIASGQTDAFQKLKSIVRMKGHDRTYQSICLVEKGCVYMSKILPWLEKMLLDITNPVFRIKGYFAVGAEEDLIVSNNNNNNGTSSSYQVEQNYVGNYYCEGSFVTGLKVYPIKNKNNNNEKASNVIVDDDAVNNVNDNKKKTMTNFDNFLYAKDSSLLDLNGTKIFIFGKGLNEGVISNEFMEMMIPKDFIPICDINTDFPVFVGNYFKLQTKEEKKLFFKDGKEENWRAAHRVSMGNKKDDVCIFYVRGKFYAIQATCPHLGGDLDKGDIEDFANVLAVDTDSSTKNSNGGRKNSTTVEPWPMVSCPQHLFSFDLRSGKGLTSKYNCNTYHLKLVGTTIYLHHPFSE